MTARSADEASRSPSQRIPTRCSSSCRRGFAPVVGRRERAVLRRRVGQRVRRPDRRHRGRLGRRGICLRQREVRGVRSCRTRTDGLVPPWNLRGDTWRGAAIRLGGPRRDREAQAALLLLDVHARNRRHRRGWGEDPPGWRATRRVGHADTRVWTRCGPAHPPPSVPRPDPSRARAFQICEGSRGTSTETRVAEPHEPGWDTHVLRGRRSADGPSGNARPKPDKAARADDRHFQDTRGMPHSRSELPPPGPEYLRPGFRYDSETTRSPRLDGLAPLALLGQFSSPNGRS